MNTSVLERDPEQPLEPAVSGVEGVDVARTPPEALLPSGTVVAGKYVIHGVLGHGGFAVVYDAEHTGLGRRVAIKVLHVRVDTPLALIERFRREARISAVVHHRNVLEVYDTGALADGSPFLVMERLSGETLADRIARGQLPLAQVVELGRQLLLAVAAIADAGIVHRDIKPANVMLHDSGEGPPCVKVVDFGISKRMALEPEPRLTSHGALVGTPQYMSPEQIRGEEVDVRTDLYAVGAVLYEALTGHAPHESRSFSELIVAVLGAPVPSLRESRADCPAELEQIILIALARSKQDRYRTPREFLDALEHFASVARLPSGADVMLAEPPSPSAEQRATSGVIAKMKRSRSAQVSLLGVLVGAQVLAFQLYGQPSLRSEATLLPSAQATTAGSGGVAAAERALESALGAQPTLAPEAEPRREEAPIEGEAPQPAKESDESERSEDGRELVRTEAPTPAREPAEERASELAEGSSRAAPAVAATTAAQAPLPSQPATASSAVAAGRHQQVMKAALAALVRGQLDEARARYAEAVRLDPRAANGYRGLGLVAARLGDHQAAREALSRYLSLAPKAADAAAIAQRIDALQ